MLFSLFTARGKERREKEELPPLGATTGGPSAPSQPLNLTGTGLKTAALLLLQIGRKQEEKKKERRKKEKKIKGKKGKGKEPPSTSIFRPYDHRRLIGGNHK